MSPNRVAVFIDHSNVVHRLSEMRKIDASWAKWYSPHDLSMKIVGSRELIKTYFYCCPPPNYWLHDGKYHQKKYWDQISYYQEIRKNKDVIISYATLKGSRDNMTEKNLDTQMSSDILMKAMKNEFDVAVIVSNDGDFVSAVQYLQQMGKKTEVLYFPNRSSMELRSICDVPRRARKSYFIEMKF